MIRATTQVLGALSALPNAAARAHVLSFVEAQLEAAQEQDRVGVMASVAHDPSTTFIVPDPRTQPVPRGWWEEVAAPVIDRLSGWDKLDEAEASLLGMAAYIDGMDGDAVEFEKALRIWRSAVASCWALTSRRDSALT